jgi:hypothetical protein
VSCPRNTRYFAGDQLAVFQGAVRAGLAVEAPRSESYGSSEQRGKNSQLAPVQRVAMKMDRRPGDRTRMACGTLPNRRYFAAASATTSSWFLPKRSGLCRKTLKPRIFDAFLTRSGE